MNRKYLYYITFFIAIPVPVWIIFKAYIQFNHVAFFFGILCLILAFLLPVAVDRFISSLFPDFLYTTYDDMRECARLRMEKREKLQEKMLFKMQYMQGIKQTIEELNEIFNANRSLKLTRWIVFRAWYKAQIDHMLKYPDIYNLSLQGEPYSKEDDPLYDPYAPDWSIFDRERDYYDSDEEDDDYDDDDYDLRRRKNKRAAEEGLAIGVGLGIGLDSADDLFSN